MEAAKLLQDQRRERNGTRRWTRRADASVAANDAVALRGRGIAVLRLGGTLLRHTASFRLLCAQSWASIPRCRWWRRCARPGCRCLGSWNWPTAFANARSSPSPERTARPLRPSWWTPSWLPAGKRTMASGQHRHLRFRRRCARATNLDVMVLEVSSFQLENIVDFRPRISVHLNLTPDHLDRYAHDGGVRLRRSGRSSATRRRTTTPSSTLQSAPARPCWRGRSPSAAAGLPADYQLVEGWLMARGRARAGAERALKARSVQHNAENMLAALAVADL